MFEPVDVIVDAHIARVDGGYIVVWHKFASRLVEICKIF